LPNNGGAETKPRATLKLKSKNGQSYAGSLS
jgi:hypothetical protein